MDYIKTLEKLKQEYNQIVSDWNGETKTFISGGNQYTETDVCIAEEIIEKCDSLIELLYDIT